MYTVSASARAYPLWSDLFEVIPYNIVREGWENPTTMTFETTTAVKTLKTARETVLQESKLLVKAPPQFTFICPLTPMVELPLGAKPLPKASCVVYHSSDAERNKLHLIFDEGLEADTKYAFLIDVVNAPYVNPTTNYFRLTTLVDNVMIESAEVPAGGPPQTDGILRALEAGETLCQTVWVTRRCFRDSQWASLCFSHSCVQASLASTSG